MHESEWEMTVSAFDLSDPVKFKQSIRNELTSAGSEEEAEILFCRRYQKSKTTTAYIKHDIAKDVFIELFGREPECRP